MASKFIPTEEFTIIAAEIKSTPIYMTDLTRLKFYGLFKQTTTGDFPESEPWMPMTKDGAMKKAWAQLKGTAPEDSQAQYISLANEILGRNKE